MRLSTAPPVAPLLTAQSLCFARAAKMILRNLSFSLTGGELMHIVGANGVGKTSLIKILCGLLRPEQGTVLWHQQNIDEHEDYRAQLCYVGHQDGVTDELTPLENLRVATVLGAPVTASPHDVLAQWDVTEMTTPCRHLSAGQRRRVALARLLLRRVGLWFLDEPLTTLDQEGRELLGKFITTHLAQGGAVVMTTHQIPDWLRAPKVVALPSGS